MSYLPKHQVQLGRGIPVPGRTRGSRDCGPRSASVGVDKLTEGAKRPGMVEMRRRMGTPGPQRTSVLDIKRGVESYRRLRGRESLRFLLRSQVADIERAISRGKGVMLAIDYGLFNTLMRRTGDPNYQGGHAIDIMGQRERRGKLWWLLYDSLDDRRRPEIPQGPRWVPAINVIKAAEAFAFDGGVQGGVYAGGRPK